MANSRELQHGSGAFIELMATEISFVSTFATFGRMGASSAGIDISSSASAGGVGAGSASSPTAWRSWDSLANVPPVGHLRINEW